MGDIVNRSLACYPLPIASTDDKHTKNVEFSSQADIQNLFFDSKARRIEALIAVLGGYCK